MATQDYSDSTSVQTAAIDTVISNNLILDSLPKVNDSSTNVQNINSTLPTSQQDSTNIVTKVDTAIAKKNIGKESNQTTKVNTAVKTKSTIKSKPQTKSEPQYITQEMSNLSTTVEYNTSNKNEFVKKHHEIISLGFLLSLVIILIITRVTLSKFLKDTLYATVNSQIANKIFRDFNMFFRRTSVSVNFIYICSTGFFLSAFYTKLINANPLSIQNEVYTPLFFMLFLFGNLVIDYLITFINGYINDNFNSSKEILFNSLLYNKLIGVVLLPINFLILYLRTIPLEIPLYIGLSIIIIILIFKVGRTLLLIIKKDFPIVQYILYLCALKILPLFIIFKVITNKL